MAENLPCFVYAIACMVDGRPRAPVKIGISANPYSRLAALQTGSPQPLVLVGMLMAPSREIARDTEQFIHECYPDRKVHGEWLSVSPWHAVGVIGHFLASRIEEEFGDFVMAGDGQ